MKKFAMAIILYATFWAINCFSPIVVSQSGSNNWAEFIGNPRIPRFLTLTAISIVYRKRVCKKAGITSRFSIHLYSYTLRSLLNEKYVNRKSGRARTAIEQTNAAGVGASWLITFHAGTCLIGIGRCAPVMFVLIELAILTDDAKISTWFVRQRPVIFAH